jgi:7,8-dihydro-6-hydroxymethylpterin-pyrophosphokinase
MEENLQVKVHWQGSFNNRYFAVKTRSDPEMALEEARHLQREAKKRRKAKLNKKRRKK